jgi:hypothetical protein
MRLPRFRIRTLMIAVAVVGVTLASGRFAQIGGRFRRIAAAHRRNQSALARQAHEFEKQAHWATWDAVAQFPLSVPDRPWSELASDSRNEAWHLRRVSAREGQLAAKYERAARRPWLPVLPDPPEPE